MSTSRALSCCLIVAFASVLDVGAQRGSAPVWFEGARLIVGDGSAPVENSAFVVEGDTFTWVGKEGERQPPAGAVRVDLSGKTVMPALIDGHNHIGLVNEKDGSNSKANYRRANLVDQLERYAYYGVAATLSMGLEADEELAYQLRDEVIPNAARFLTVGKGIAATPIGGPTGEPRLGIPYGARTEKEGRAHVKELRAHGVRFVKIWVDDRNGDAPKIQPNVYRAIIAEAHANGMEVLAHLSRTSALADAKDLLRAGVDGFVHLVRDKDVDDDYLAAVKAHPKVWSGPNIPVPSTRDSVASLAETLPAAQIATMRAQLTQRESNGNPPDQLFELHCRNLRKIHEAGMVIGMGTDGTGDGFGAHEQIEAYTRCGMTTMEALVAGTGTNARLLHLDRMGTIAARKEASFNVLNANPLDDITNTRRIATVYLRGRELDRQALKARFVPGPGRALSTDTSAPQVTACDRACLETTLDAYVDALVAREPSRLALAMPGLMFTENGQRLELGDGLWHTVTGRGRYALKLADVEAGQAVLMGTIREADVPTILVARLKVANRRIAEVETLVIRNKAAAESLDAIGAPRRVWARPVPESERSTRAELVRIANMYFSGIELNDGKGAYPIADTCARLENGAVTAGDPALVLGSAAAATGATRVRLGCREQFQTGMFHYVTRIRDRRFVLVDPERGLAFAFAFFDNAAGDARHVTLTDGRKVVSGSAVPWTWQIAEVFRIEKGLIGDVESVLHPVPYGMGSGWSSHEDAMSSQPRW